MIQLNQSVVAQILDEINGTAERDRRAIAKKRLEIYRDGGRRFLIEQIKKEFGEEALSEMRVAPINLLKKIINKKSQCYRKPPVRTTENEKDQALVDYYVATNKLNELGQKLNKYYNLFSNAALYCRPAIDKVCSVVVPPFLYSKVPNELDQTKTEAIIFNTFTEDGRISNQNAVPSASGFETFSQEKQAKVKGDLVSSNEYDAEDNRRYMIWTATEHKTVDGEGNAFYIPEAGDEQFLNPIQMLPVIEVTKDRDNEPWAQQGDDMVDLTMAIQLGWTDLLTIAKHQGFSILTIISEEEPKKLTIGINRAVWLKVKPDSPVPSISYVQGQSPLDQYKQLLMDLLGLLLTTNDMDPQSIGGSGSTRNFTSGFHALIAMSDNLEAIEADKPVLLQAELDHWNLIKTWHNFMWDNGTLNEEARQLGKFSDTFKINVQFADVKPLESEDEVLARVEKQRDMGLLTREDALKKLYPDLSQEQLTQKMKLIDEEMAKFRSKLVESEDTEEDTEEENGQD